jgi:hypothetical protein
LGEKHYFWLRDLKIQAYRLGYNALLVRQNASTISEEHIVSIFRTEERAKQESRIKQTAQLSASFTLGLIYEGGDLLLWNVGLLSSDCMALYPRRYNYLYINFAN